MTFEKALVDNFSSPADHLAVWLAYCDYYRRQTHQDTANNEGNHKEMLAIFVRARSKLVEGM